MPEDPHVKDNNFIEPNRGAPEGVLDQLSRNLKKSGKGMFLLVGLVGFVAWQIAHDPPAGPKPNSSRQVVNGPVRPIAMDRDVETETGAEKAAQEAADAAAEKQRKIDELKRIQEQNVKRAKEMQDREDERSSGQVAKSVAAAPVTPQEGEQRRREFMEQAYLAPSTVSWIEKKEVQKEAHAPSPENARPVQQQSVEERLPECSMSGGGYWIPEGTVIEAVLANEINGEQPGPVIALVSTDYKAEGTRVLLIPKGTKLLGRAQKVAAFGQTRLLTTFHRMLIYPPLDVSSQPCSVDLKSEEAGLDQMGASGLPAKVNNHLASLLLAASVVGVIQGAAVGTQIGGTYGPSVTITNGLTQSTSNIVARILDRYTNRLPSATVPAGTRIKLEYTKDRKQGAYPSGS